MLGSLRFILATIVALSHIGWHPLGINPGISAVVMFYLISGYVVAGLWQRLQPQPHRLLSFYRDRLIRIYPTYLAVLVIGMLSWWALAPESYFLSRTPGPAEWLNNLTIVPLNYYMWNQSDQFAIIPPAWSLGTELQFYALLPLVLIRPRLFFCLSLAIAIVAQAGWLPREWFTYRLLPGVLHIFLCGSLIALAPCVRQRRHTALLLWGTYALLALLLLVLGGYQHARDYALFPQGAFNISPELMTGLLIGIPALLVLAPLRAPKWDQIAGHLSYGIFLNHFIVIWWLNEGTTPKIDHYLAGSVIMALLTWWLVERPAQTLRYKLRLKAAPAT